MLTLFASPKPFRLDHVKLIQRNAIRSWTLLNPRPEIFLMGNDEGVAEIAEEFGVTHIPGIAVNDYGTPLIRSLFETAQRLGQGKYCVYVNSDIILFNDLLTTLEQIPFPEFLLVGQRWNLDVTEPIAFDQPNWHNELRDRARREGKLEGPQAMDYFAFPRGQYHDLPDFAVGRPAWDNWMLYRAFNLGIPVLDGTEVIPIVHQNHDYNHHPQGKFGVWAGPESEINLKLAGGWDNSTFNLQLATWKLTPEGLKRPEWIKQNFDQYLKQLALAHASAKSPTYRLQWEMETLKQSFHKRSFGVRTS